MADSTDDILKNFLAGLGEGFTREDKENIKKAFKGLSVVLENKDDLKKAIETLKLKGEISEEQAAKMQQEAEETRAFRAKTDEYRRQLREDLKSLKDGFRKFNEYQERLYSPTLKAQKELIAMGESVKKGVFAQALSNSLIEGFGKDNNFQKLFGSTNASQDISKGISGLMKSWRGLKEIKALMTKDSPERKLADAHKGKNAAQKEYERLQMRISETKEEISTRKKLGISTEEQEKELNGLISRIDDATTNLGKWIAEESDAIRVMKLGKEGFEKEYGFEVGSKRHQEKVEFAASRYKNEALAGAGITQSEVNKAKGDDQSIKETPLQQIANEKEDKSEEKLEKVVLPEKGAPSQKKAANKKDGSDSVKEGGQLQKMFVHFGDDSVKLEKTKTPNTYPQVVGAFSLWLEEELKDKDDEKKSSKGASGGKSGGGLADLWAAGSMLKTALTMLVRFGGLLSRLGPMLLNLGPLVGQAALVAGAGVIAYKVGNYIGESWSNWFDEREKKAMEEAKQREQQERAKMKKDYAEADDEGKAKLAQEYQKENAELAEKQVKAKEKQRKLIEEKNAALASGDTEKAQKLSMKIGELEEEYKEYARKREKYKEIAQKENERQESKSKSEVDMKKAETGAGKATLEVTKQMATDMHTLVENMPQMVSAGTAAGINNA